jgi:kynureninase
VYVNEKHHKNTEIPVLSGWWGNKLESRFQMKYKIDNYETAERWQVSNPSIYAAVPIRASLELFNEVGMPALLKKSRLLTNYLEFILEDLNKEATVLKIITPKEPTERGCQISVMLCQVKEGEGKSFVENLTKEGVVADWREPNIMRCAPVPFYNSFEDIFRLGQILRKLLYP